MLREAARRRGIPLRWVRHERQSDTAIASGSVDLWTIWVVTTERQRLHHLTEPYLDYDYGFLVQRHSRFRLTDDLSHALVGSNAMPMSRRSLLDGYPQVSFDSSPSFEVAIDKLCRGQVDAVFGALFILYATQLERPSCPDVGLRMLPAPAVRTQLAIGSTRESAAVADELRAAIGDMLDDGTAERIAGRFGGMTTHALLSLRRAQHEAGTVARYRAAAWGAGILLLLALAGAWAYRGAALRARRAHAAQQRAERELRLMAASLSDMVLAYDLQRRLTFANRGAERLTGFTAGELSEMEFGAWIHADDRASALQAWERVFAGEMVELYRYRLMPRQGAQRWISATWGPIRDEAGGQVGVQATDRDITAQVQAEDERAHLQAQLLQAQKLESVGRLAGGVAHDFNNLLTVIGGCAELLHSALQQEDERQLAAEIVKAGKRASDLTGQLLAFSRKQLIAPKLVDLNSLVEESLRMLRRLIGEDITLKTALASPLHPVLIDPGQFGQVLMNLAANARDAMPGAGTLLIETSNTHLDKDYCGDHPDVQPGEYVQLTFSDSGTGMTAETLGHIFDPFFTTKSVGQGTGLGLATVYGIVKQSGGHIWVYSELGKGSSFKLYFPCATSQPADAPETGDVARATGGNETLLVVEDQAELRQFILRVLSPLGYRLLNAADADAALALAGDHAGSIDLLITDVVMPGRNGRELAEMLQTARPGMRVLYMSGYTANVIVHRGVLDHGVNYLAKPFSPAGIATKVRTVLDQAG